MRANQVLEALEPVENTAYLSGLLIGGEVLDAEGRAGPEEPILLCATRKFSRLYALAFEALGLSERLTVVRLEEAELACALGQRLILQRSLSGRSS